jgi:hypothetical protein
MPNFSKGTYRIHNDEIRVQLGLPKDVNIRIIQDPLYDECDILLLSNYSVPNFTTYNGDGRPLKIEYATLQIAKMEKTKRICAAGWNEKSEAWLQKLKDLLHPQVSIDDLQGQTYITITPDMQRRWDESKLEDLKQQVAELEQRMKVEDEANEK